MACVASQLPPRSFSNDFDSKCRQAMSKEPPAKSKPFVAKTPMFPPCPSLQYGRYLDKLGSQKRAPRYTFSRSESEPFPAKVSCIIVGGTGFKRILTSSRGLFAPFRCRLASARLGKS